MKTSDESPRQREEIFHDQWAETASVSAIDLAAIMEGVTALENRYILQKLGDLRGLVVVELGAGLAEASVYFAKKGAWAVATDLSSGMLRFARRLAQDRGAPLQTAQTSAEQLAVRGPPD